MEPWRAWALIIEGVEARNGALEGLYNRPVVADLHHFNEEQDPDPDTDPH
jgi:hypothetical protein